MTSFLPHLQPMPKIDHNGEDFRYEVGYKRNDIPDAPEEKQIVWDAEQKELTIPNVQTFKEYTLYVRAVNKIGPSPESRLTKMIGFSGEGREYRAPLVVAVS